MTNFTVRPNTQQDQPWIQELITHRWGSEIIVVHEESITSAQLPCFIAEINKENVGLITYRFKQNQCEIITLDSLQARHGIGSALICTVKMVAKEHGCLRLYLVTTNDNTAAMRFYQQLGFSILRVYRFAVDKARLIKPQIPMVGNDNIPIHDEIEMEMKL